MTDQGSAARTDAATEVYSEELSGATKLKNDGGPDEADNELPFVSRRSTTQAAAAVAGPTSTTPNPSTNQPSGEVTPSEIETFAVAAVGNPSMFDTTEQESAEIEALPVPAKKRKAKSRRRRRRNPASAQERTAPVKVAEISGPARMKKRHWGLLSSFLFVVLAPLVAAVTYLFVVAENQYHSISGFTVRSQDESSATDLLGGLAQFTGGSIATDSDILYEFIQSQEMVEAVDARIDLRAHYSRFWPNDWIYSIWPDASQEDLISYWNRVVGVSYDPSTGLIEVQTKAFDPETARAINDAIVSESQLRINELNLQAREDAMQYAIADLNDAVILLKGAREALTNFRTRSQIVDPETDIQTRMGVMTSLQQQLAEALVEYDLLLGTSTSNDPRLTDVAKKIDVIRARIAIERQNFASSSTETGGVDQDYPTLISEFERLTVDREYAEQFYFASLTALESARNEANRQSRYLATYIKPTKAQDSEYPRRFVLSALIGLFLLLGWSIMALIYYSIRDRS